jgi:PTS system mannose-specific IID component
MLLVPFLIYFIARWPFFWWGYRQSTKIIEDVGGQGDFNLLRDAAQVLGLTVIGGFIPDILKGFTFKYKYFPKIDGKPVGDPFDLQGLLDGMVPYILPIALVAFCYWMLKRRLTPVTVIIIIAVITFGLGVLKVL